MNKTWKRVLAGMLSAAMALPAVSLGTGLEAKAQQISGDAPFINTWLVSGPFDTAAADEIYGMETEQLVNYSTTAEITASSSLDVNPPSNVADGTTKKQWVAEETEPWLNFAWEEPISINQVKISQWGDGRHVNDWYHLTFTLADGSAVESGQIDSTSRKADEPTVYERETLDNVVSMKLEVDKGRTPYPSITGVSEVEIYYDRSAEEGGEGTGAEITPVLGESFGTEASGEHAWEYFDDRLYNRTYDDYQDLMGYYTVKKGQDTKNKYLYAHTYVYSPKEQEAYFNIGATGSYRVYVNDECVSGTPTVPKADPQKDDQKLPITLEKGWNKILIQLFHVYTEDTDSNGIPTAADAAGVYAGFYGRVADADGNPVDGVISSVTGESDELQIVTGSLYTGDTLETALPENNMPTGYKEWPYVWNKSLGGNKYGVSASAFQFMAAGGAPGYTWEIVDGQLPDGLHLKEDGTISDGLVNGKADLDNPEGIIPIDCPTGDYTFTVQVTDQDGKTAQKEFTITVEDRPNQWFEDGKVGALTHVVPIYNLMLDSNYDIDGWARRAKEQGHSLVSIESIQQAYFWPSKFNNPDDDRHMYYPKDENGKLVDALKPFEEAVKRYGMEFGLYYGPAFGTKSTDSYVQDLTDLITRYDPVYLYFDGPQSMGHQNFDIIYSAVRNLNNKIIINANAWGSDYGDIDLRTEEAAGIYSGGWQEFTVKKTVMEPWKMIRTKNAQSPYYGMRDDYRQVIKEMIMNTGRGYADNNDQTILDSRGPSRGDSVEKMALTWAMSVQEFIDVRELVTEWFAPEGKPERHEAMTGTMPYYLSGWGFEDDGRGNWNEFALAKNGLGPDWGYAVSRDNNIYLHIIEGPDNKDGFDAESIADGKMTISPVEDKVTEVTWFNEDVEIPFEQKGDTVTIDLTDVKEDQIDTIIKVVTDKKEREYTLTDLYVSGEQLSDSQIQLIPEGQMTFPALKAELEKVIYDISDSSKGIQVDENGLVTASANAEGTVQVTVTGTYEGNSASDTVTVTAHGGIVYLGGELTGVTLKVEGKETYNEVTTPQALSYELSGRSIKGGSTGMNPAEITWHAGYVNVADGTNYTPLALDETNEFTFADGKILTPAVTESARAAVWADVTQDGETYTTNKVFLELKPYENLMADVNVTASEELKGTKAENTVDGIVMEGASFDESRWSADGDEESWLAFDLGSVKNITNIQVHFNSDSQKYYNTPKTMELQVSKDGKDWETVNSVTGPKTSSRAYFGFPDEYSLDGKTQYVRLLFPDGSNGSRLDILEVKINGSDPENRLAAVLTDPEPIDSRTAGFSIVGVSETGKELDLSGADIQITSEQPDIVTINENNQAVSVSEGRAKIVISVSLNGVKLTDDIYLDVDSGGTLSFPRYLDTVTISTDQTDLSVGKPAALRLEAFDNAGKAADLSGAEIAFTSDSENLTFVDGASVVMMKNSIPHTVNSTVQASVTVDGITVNSNVLVLSEIGTNAASGASVTVSSVRDRNGSYDGNNQDERYLGTKAIDGDRSTSWAAKQSDISPWIELDFGKEQTIDSLNLIDRGHQVNEIGEGKLEFFDSTGALVYEQMVTGIAWNGQPDNVVKLETPVAAQKIRFTIDPEQNYFHNGSGEHPERGLAEIEVSLASESGDPYIVSFQTVYVSTETGTQPALPEKAYAVLSDGTLVKKEVTWDKVPEESLNTPGILHVEGTVADTEVRAMAEIKVVQGSEPVKPADKTLLQKTYDYALTLSTDGVVDSAKKFFEDALAEAAAVLADETATQDEVNAAWDNLLEGIWGLGLVQGDKTTLELLINRAESMIANEDKYVAENWQILAEALAEAKTVYDDGDALQDNVQTAADALLEAILAQRYKADKSNLADLIAKAEGIDTAKYTAKSVQVFRAAFASARAVFADENLSMEDQKQVDTAVYALQAAINGLEPASTDDGKDEPSGGDDGNSGDDNSNTGNNGNSGDDGSNAENNGNAGNNTNSGTTVSDADAPKTGDYAPLLPWTAAVILAVLLGSTVMVRKKR